MQPTVLLAAHYRGRPIDPGADEVWGIVRDGTDNRLHLVEWSDPKDLDQKLTLELETALELNGSDAELKFEESLGGRRYGNFEYTVFLEQVRRQSWCRIARRCVANPIARPARPGGESTPSTVRFKREFRRHVRELASQKGWARRVPRAGWSRDPSCTGDKVINVLNQRRYNVWPKPEWVPYVANGDLGVIVGQVPGQENARGLAEEAGG